MAVLSSDSFETSTPASRAQKGPLIRVELQPGRFVKMYKADAIAKGLIESDDKQPGKNRPAPEDKIRRPEGDKSGAMDTKEDDPPPVADDFTTIAGVGLATARALQARGIATFDDLRAASDAGKLDFLTPQTRLSIEVYFDAQ